MPKCDVVLSRLGHVTHDADIVHCRVWNHFNKQCYLLLELDPHEALSQETNEPMRFHLCQGHAGIYCFCLLHYVTDTHLQ